jgi:hypothetical protein
VESWAGVEKERGNAVISIISFAILVFYNYRNFLPCGECKTHQAGSQPSPLAF